MLMTSGSETHNVTETADVNPLHVIFVAKSNGKDGSLNDVLHKLTLRCYPLIIGDKICERINNDFINVVQIRKA